MQVCMCRQPTCTLPQAHLPHICRHQPELTHAYSTHTPTQAWGPRPHTHTHKPSHVHAPKSSHRCACPDLTWTALCPSPRCASLHRHMFAHAQISHTFACWCAHSSGLPYMFTPLLSCKPANSSPCATCTHPLLQGTFAFSGLTHEAYPRTSSWCTRVNTCTPFQCAQVYPRVSSYTTHIKMHTVCSHPDLTPSHTCFQVSSPLQSCYSRNHPGHQSCFAHRANSASKLYPSPGSVPGSSTNPAGGIQQCFQHSTAYWATPRGSPLPSSSHPSLHISHRKQKMSSGAGQLCQGTRAGAPSHHELLKQQCPPPHA